MARYRSRGSISDTRCCAAAGTDRRLAARRFHADAQQGNSPRRGTDGVIGIDPAPLSSAELGKFIQSEIAHWAKLVKLANIQPE